ncbi:MAG TPA: hypothetical protein VFD58_07240 [Blastocatellia bacterium]|nr:hypothetical protein [Blastocatellia bacterium]
MKDSPQQGSQKLSRRRFIGAGTLAALSAGAVFCLPEVAMGQSRERESNRGAGSRRAAAEQRRVRDFELTRSSFTPYLGNSFRVVSQAMTPVFLTLGEINDLPAQRRQAASSPESESAVAEEKDLSFALVFRGFRHTPLRQQTCLLEHPLMGKFVLMIVPVGADEAWCYYEAVFNRSLPR